jgi:hypothetical protein
MMPSIRADGWRLQASLGKTHGPLVPELVATSHDASGVKTEG